jgi:hypothetical protein
MERWDPYVLPAKSLRRALLDTKKVETIAESVKSIVRIVPKADEWVAKTREQRLTLEDLQGILCTVLSGLKERLATCDIYGGPPSVKEPKHVGEVPDILRIAGKALGLAEDFKGKSTFFRRAEAIMRMVAYALMEVALAVGEATNDEVSNRSVVLCVTLISGG